MRRVRHSTGSLQMRRVSMDHRDKPGGDEVNAKQRRVSGAQGRNRTTDTCIFSAVLYRLSYLGLPWA
jgi:hypothetical protein